MRQFYWYWKLPWITSQWNYVLHLRFGLPFKTFALVSILSKNIPVWHWVFYCNIQFHWKKIGLPCLINIHENDILPVKLPTVCMECNGRKYCGCGRCLTWVKWCWRHRNGSQPRVCRHTRDIAHTLKNTGGVSGFLFGVFCCFQH